jgi:hypothetical protein
MQHSAGRMQLDVAVAGGKSQVGVGVGTGIGVCSSATRRETGCGLYFFGSILLCIIR